LRRAIEAFRAADYQSALGELAHVHTEVPDHGPANLLRGQCYLALGDYEAASAALHLACRKMPADAWGLILQTSPDLYANNNQLAAHLRALEAHVEHQPDDGAALFVLGFEYLYLGFAAEAIQELEQALAVTDAGPAPEGVERRHERAIDPIAHTLLRRAHALSRPRTPTQPRRVREL
jgi:tetratricopeptide (TPR) repeat protein